MTQPFLGEIKIFACTFAPKRWAFCDGQLMAISQNESLFSLVGTTYGGDGRTTFGLPNLEGRVPIHMGNGFTQGERGGEYTHTLSISEIPTHVHAVRASTATPNSASPSGNYLGETPIYGPAKNLTSLAPQTVASAGGSQPHQNTQPYLALNFCIALFGIFPSRTS